MSQPRSGQPSRRLSPQARAVQSAIQSSWRQLSADDRHEPDLDRLAAWADGRLAPSEESVLASELSTSPASLEILAALLADEPGRPLPSSEAAPVPPPALTLSRPTMSQPAPHRRAPLAMWAMAASLLVAAWLGVRSRGLQNEVAELGRRNRAAASALLLSEKARLAETAGAGRPYLLGQTSPELAENSIEAIAMELRLGGSRSTAVLSSDERADLEAARRRMASAAEQVEATTMLGELESVAALLETGRVAEAGERLDVIEQPLVSSPETRAQWENLRAGVYAQEASELPSAASDPVWTRARTLFESAASHGLDEAWLNLAHLHLARRDRTAAIAAAREYLRRTDDRRQRELLQELLGPPSVEGE